MKKVFTTLTFSLAFLFAFMAFAQDVLPVPVPEVTNAEFFESLLKAIGGAKGASTLAIVAAALQVLFKLLGTPLFSGVWKKLEPKVKFLIVAVLSIGTMTTGLMIASAMPLGAALLHSTVVTAIMNYAYKYYELYIEKKA